MVVRKGVFNLLGCCLSGSASSFDCSARFSEELLRCKGAAAVAGGVVEVLNFMRAGPRTLTALD